MDLHLNDKVVLITGGTDGLGAVLDGLAAAAPDLLAMRRAVMERMPGRGLAVLR